MEQETEVSVPPLPVGWGIDHFPCRQKTAAPFSSTATHSVLDGQETPYRDEWPVDSAGIGFDQTDRVPPGVADALQPATSARESTTTPYAFRIVRT